MGTVKCCVPRPVSQRNVSSLCKYCHLLLEKPVSGVQVNPMLVAQLFTCALHCCAVRTGINLLRLTAFHAGDGLNIVDTKFIMVSAPSCNKVHIQIQSELPLSLTSFLFSSGRGTSARTRFLSPYAFPRRRPRARRRVRRSLPPPRGACRADRKGVPPRGAASRRAGGERLPPIRPAHHRRGARMVRNALLRPCFHLCVRHVELEEARSEAQPSVIWGRKKACPQQCRTGRDAKRSACTPLGLDDHVKKKVGWNHQKRRT